MGHMGRQLGVQTNNQTTLAPLLVAHMRGRTPPNHAPNILGTFLPSPPCPPCTCPVSWSQKPGSSSQGTRAQDPGSPTP